METIDIIKQLCSNKGISVSQLESDLGYGNGSVAKSKNMSADRMYQIAKYFGVSMEYLVTGKSLKETDDEMSVLRQQQSILMNINKISQRMSDLYKEIAECQEELSLLKREYNKIEIKKKDKNTGISSNPSKPDLLDIPQFTVTPAENNQTLRFEDLMLFDDELPFK